MARYFFGLLEKTGKLWLIHADSERQAKRRRAEILRDKCIVVKDQNHNDRTVPLTDIVNVSHIKPSRDRGPSWSLAWSNRAPTKAHITRVTRSDHA